MGVRVYLTPTEENKLSWQYKFLIPALLVLLSIVAFPTFFLFYVSFHEWVLFKRGMPFIGFENFSRVLTSSEFLQSLKVSVMYTFSTTTLTFILGLGLALILNEQLKGRGIMRTLIALPLVIPPVVAGFAWKFALNREVGVIGAFILPAMGFMKSLLADPSLALSSIILADIWSKTSLMFLILLAGLQAVSPDLYEAARIDGASSWQLFSHITFPLIKPAIIIALIIRFIDAFNVFDAIFVMTSGGPGTATQTFPLLGWKIGFLYFHLGQAATLAIIMLIMTIGVSIFLIRRIT